MDNTLEKAQKKAVEISMLIAKMSRITEILEPLEQLLEILTGTHPFTENPIMRPQPPDEKSIILQAIQAHNESSTILRISRTTGLTKSVIEQVIEILIEEDMIEREAKKGWKRYKVKQA